MGRVSDAKERLMNAVSELFWTGSYGSTTIDQICERAGVKKGSFYYFFDSKSDLATAALEARWKERRAELDAIFSAITPPLERLRKYCDNGYEFQRQIRSKYGRVLGCPLFALGAEICTQDDALRKKIEEILAYNRRYLESAIRDAHTTGAIDAPNPAAKAEMIQAYCEGLLTRARIENDVKLLRDAVRGVFAILGVAEKEKIAA